MWCIPPEQSAEFVYHMEDVLEVYQRPHDPRYPVVCLDETSRQLIGEVRPPLPPRPGVSGRYDGEYVRNGVANLFMAFEPLAGWRQVCVTDHRCREGWAAFVKHLADGRYKDATTIVLVMDQLAQHPYPGLALRGVPAGRGPTPHRQARDPSHAEARLLARHG
jgi:DDE superfamily endonuclease